MRCPHCGTELPDPFEKISFRAVCDRCGAALHSCFNCKYYKPGLSNDCAIQGTEWVPDRSVNNFCEEFSLLGKGPAKHNDAKKRFNDLFKE